MNIDITINIPVGEHVDLASADTDQVGTTTNGPRADLPPMPVDDAGAGRDPMSGSATINGSEPPPALDELGLDVPAAGQVGTADVPPPSLDQLRSWAAGASSHDGPPEVAHLVLPAGQDPTELLPPTLDELRAMDGSARKRRKDR